MLTQLDEICEIISKALEEMGLTVDGKFTDQTRKLLEEQKIVVSVFADPGYFERLLTAIRLKPRGSFADNTIIPNIASKINVDEQNAIVNKYDFDVISIFSRIKTLICPNQSLIRIGSIQIFIAPLFAIEFDDNIENVYKSVHDELLKYGFDICEFCNPTSKFSCIFKNYAFMNYQRKHKDLYFKAFAKHFYKFEFEDENYTEEESELVNKYDVYYSAVASIARLKNMEITQVRLEIPTKAYIDFIDKTIKVSME